LRLSEEHTRALIDRISFGLFRCTADGRLLDANRALATMLAYPDEGRLLSANLFADLAPGTEGEGGGAALLAAHIVRGTLQPSYDVHCRRLDGTTVQLRLTVAAESDERGMIRQVHGVVENITERMRREEIVRRGERMASLGRTLAGVAHEINNPLAAITGFAQILLKRDQSPDDRHAHETMLREARRAARIVKDLLTIARREEGGERMRVDLHTIVRYIVDTQRYAMETRGIRATLQLAGGGAYVLADAAQLEQVVLNLVVNARQALEARIEERRLGGPASTGDDWSPALDVSTRVDDGTVTLVVDDNGSGIAPQDLPNIWDPFWTTREEGEGTGLGLAVVHSIVVSHGGTIEVTSTPGSGTRFTITLPLLHEAGATWRSDRGATGRWDTSRSRKLVRPLDILVVDDEAVIRELLSRYFTSRGHAVLAAVNGEHALRLAEKASFDVVISDLRMPGMDGRELIRRLQALPSQAHTRFILSTGDATATPGSMGGGRGSDVEVVNKPYDVDALVDLVEGRRGDTDAPSSTTSDRDAQRWTT